MNKKNTLLYCAALLVCFLLGCAVSLGLRLWDSQRIVPLSGGQTMDFTSFGFTMDVPQDFVLSDYTEENLASGGNALYAAGLESSQGGLYLFVYENLTGDDLADYPEQDVVSHYMSAGASEVRTREFGGRRFICYRAGVEGENGTELWDSYETWDKSLQITFETHMAPEDVLPILATIDFTD